MELWIRSQDRLKLTKADYIEYGEWNKEYRIYVNGEIFAIYKKKKRALKILDEIQNLLEPRKIIKSIDNSVRIEHYDFIVNPTYETITQPLSCVYELPNDERIRKDNLIFKEHRGVDFGWDIEGDDD